MTQQQTPPGPPGARPAALGALTALAAAAVAFTLQPDAQTFDVLWTSAALGTVVGTGLVARERRQRWEAAADGARVWASQPRPETVPAAAGDDWSDLPAGDGGGDESAALALGVWEWTYRNGYVRPRDLWFLVTDPGGEEPYDWNAAPTLADLFGETERVTPLGPDGWVALVAPTAEHDDAEASSRFADAVPGVTLTDAVNEYGVSAMLAVSVDARGDAGWASAPLVPGVRYADRLTPGYALGPIRAGGPGAVTVDVSPWLARIAGVSLRSGGNA